MQTNIEQEKKEEIEVELPEEVKVEEQAQDTSQQEIKVEETQDNKDEVENYSVKVKSRIDKLTKRLREAERREEAAIAFAKGVQQEKDKIAGAYQKLDKNYIDDLSKSVEDRLGSAKEKLKAAITNRDVDEQISANELIAKLTIDRERIAFSKQQQEETVDEKPVETQPQQPVAPKPDPKAVEWANKNDWYGDDEVMTESAKAIHRELIRNGVDPSSEEYYSSIDKKIREYFPQKFTQEENVEIDSKPIQPVASTTRSNVKKAGRRVVRLTPSQVAMAKRLGVPINEYAKYVKEA